MDENEDKKIDNGFGLDDLSMPSPDDYGSDEPSPPEDEDFERVERDLPEDDMESGKSNDSTDSDKEENTPANTAGKRIAELNSSIQNSADFNGAVSHQKEESESKSAFDETLDDVDKEHMLSYNPDVSVSAEVDSCGRSLPNSPQEKMQLVKKYMPQLWNMILTSNCCPKMIGLYDRCTPNLPCSECWERAIHVDTKTRAYIDTNGSYVCSQDGGVLMFKRVINKTSQLWQCPTCNTLFKITMDTPSKLTSAVKVNTKE